MSGRYGIASSCHGINKNGVASSISGHIAGKLQMRHGDAAGKMPALSHCKPLESLLKALAASPHFLVHAR
jgi:hypothetical protein